MEKKVIPHCPICLEEMKVGQEVVLDGTFKGILHTDCSYLTLEEVEDQGLYEEIIRRNQRWLKQFNHTIMH
ncbi:hypothetical protein GCM10009865_22190 [Aeromicrobium ponti]|uniref:Uncharacterized protein n=1 Tax=Cytobacillus oceanisediminis TaxID=665099 RepID=A0A562JWE2_9BACI|nr:hypothetical protein [Cytobacillus oceanisediminis]TWH87498.1 hypothetical protein IQ19_02453 [Cytobacillus oceanisediminis]